MRTLQNWKRRIVSGVDQRRLGRPSHGHRARLVALIQTCRELRRQGYGVGAEAIWRSLARVSPLRLVRWATKQLKARKKKRQRLHRERARISVQVHKTNALWCLDGTHLGRAGRAPIEGQVMKDVASLRFVGFSVGPPAKGSDVVRLLDASKQRRGCLPLVVSTDNGSAYTCHLVARYLAREQVVHLKTRAHTPQHNGWAERGMRELKEDGALGKGVQLDVREAASRLTTSRNRLDLRRCRRSRGYRTAAQCDEQMPGWYDAVSRRRFYKAATRAVEEATRDAINGHARRQKEREAIFRTMEDFNLISRTRGGEPLNAREHETVS